MKTVLLAILKGLLDWLGYKAATGVEDAQVNNTVEKVKVEIKQAEQTAQNAFKPTDTDAEIKHKAVELEKW